MENFEQISSQEVFKGEVFTIYNKTFRDESSKVFTREIVEREGSTGIIATFPNTDKALFVLEWCAGINEWVISIPGGRTNRTYLGQQISEVLKELKEETGYEAENITKLIEFDSMPGYMKRNVILFHGTIRENENTKIQNLEEFEYIKYKIISINDIINNVKIGTLEYKIDPEGLLALMLWKFLKD